MTEIKPLYPEDKGVRRMILSVFPQDKPKKLTRKYGRQTQASWLFDEDGKDDKTVLVPWGRSVKCPGRTVPFLPLSPHLEVKDPAFKSDPRRPAQDPRQYPGQEWADTPSCLPTLQCEASSQAQQLLGPFN